MARRRTGAGELARDYVLLGKMSKELDKRRKNIRAIGKRVVRGFANTDLDEGIVENLEIVSGHMQKAQKEIDKAMKKLKMI